MMAKANSGRGDMVIRLLVGERRVWHGEVIYSSKVARRYGTPGLVLVTGGGSC